jgi:hypothetical protein
MSRTKFENTSMSTNTTKWALLQISNKLDHPNRHYKVERGNTREAIAQKLINEFRYGSGRLDSFKENDDDEIEKMATGIVKRGETFKDSGVSEPKKKEGKPEFAGVRKVKKEAGWTLLYIKWTLLIE